MANAYVANKTKVGVLSGSVGADISPYLSGYSAGFTMEIASKRVIGLDYPVKAGTNKDASYNLTGVLYGSDSGDVVDALRTALVDETNVEVATVIPDGNKFMYHILRSDEFVIESDGMLMANSNNMVDGRIWWGRTVNSQTRSVQNISNVKANSRCFVLVKDKGTLTGLTVTVSISGTTYSRAYSSTQLNTPLHRGLFKNGANNTPSAATATLTLTEAPTGATYEVYVGYTTEGAD